MGSGSQSLDRGLEILDLLDLSNEPLGVREIARQMGLKSATVQRLIKSLHSHRFIQQDPETRRYSIGFRALGLGNSILSTDKLIMEANIILRQLATDHQLNGFIGQLHDDRAMYLLCVQSNGPVTIRNSPGELTYLHTTAMGKVLLSAMSDDEVRKILGSGPLPKLTESTLDDPGEVLDHVRQARTKGFAYVQEETLVGVVSVGAPIRDRQGRVIAALSGAFPRGTSPELTLDGVAPLVVRAAQDVSTALGWQQS